MLVTIPYPSRKFYLFNNNKSLIPASESPNGSGFTLTASCISGTSWSEDDGKCVDIIYSPTATITANPSSVLSGNSSTLTWSSSHADTCSSQDFITGVDNPTSGTVTVTPLATTIYSIVCFGPGGQAPDQATVTVTVIGKKPIFKEN